MEIFSKLVWIVQNNLFTQFLFNISIHLLPVSV